MLANATAPARPEKSATTPVPLYLISALLMTIGCYTVSHSLDLRVGNLSGLLTLLGVLTIYETMLIGLGLYLLLRRRAVSDGVLLLLIETLFFFDATHLNAELISARPAEAGVWAAAVLLVSAAKLLLAARFLNLRLSAGHAIAVGAGLISVVVMPAYAASVSQGRELTVGDIYPLWWAIGAIMGLHGVWFATTRQCFRVDRVRGVLGAAFLAGMYFALVAHLLALGWVYHVGFRVFFASPVILAAVPWLAAHRAQFSREMLWPAFAVLLSLAFPRRLMVELGVSPFRATLLAVTLCYLWLAWFRKNWAFLLPMVVALVTSLLGPTPGIIATRIDAWWAVGLAKGRAHLPRGGLFWGWASILAAFVTLSLGAAVNLRRRSKPV